MKTQTVVIGGAALVVGFLVVKKLQAPKPATGSLSGLTGGNIADIGKSIGRGLSSIFGGDSPSDSPSSKLNVGALDFLTPSQRIDLGMQEPTNDAAGSASGSPFFGPDINADGSQTTDFA